MPFYIRKSVSVGPFRFNLSKGGIGLSAGVKGFRLGSWPRGNYVHMGRKGLYYRASLGSRKRSRSSPRRSPSPAAPRDQPPAPAVEQPLMTDVEAGDVLHMQDASLENIVAQINAKPWTLWPFIAIGGVLLLVYLEGLQVGGSTLRVLAALLAVGTLFAAYKDKVRKTVVVMYELEGGAADAYSTLCAAFDKLAKCLMIWNVDARGSRSDWKTNFGVTGSVRRSPVRLSYGPPPTVRTNISV